MEFIKNDALDSHELKQIDTIYGCDVYMQTKANRLWDESTRSMLFIMKNGDASYVLPRILYDIDNDGVCYIYGVQNSDGIRNKSIERKIYSLNKGINNTNLHPSKIVAMLVFTKYLKSQNITKIKMPSCQALSYRYHELLSRIASNELERLQQLYMENSDDDYIKTHCDDAKKWYDRVYNKQDKINYLKTVEFINLAYRAAMHDTDIVINDEDFKMGDILELNLKRK